MSKPEEGIGTCLLPKPPLPVGVGINARWICNKNNEWELYDPWVAKTFGKGAVLTTVDGLVYKIKTS